MIHGVGVAKLSSTVPWLAPMTALVVVGGIRQIFVRNTKNAVKR
jgi:hypothetical protein